MSQCKRNIRLLVRGLEGSPALQNVFQLANWLAQDGWHVEIVTPDYHGMDLPFPLDDRVRLTMFGTQEQGSLRRRAAYFALSVWRVCRGTDVAVATSWHAAYHLFIGRIVGPQTKLVYLIQDYEPETHVRQGKRRHQPLQAILYWLAISSYRLPLRRLTISESLKTRITSASVTLSPEADDARTRYQTYFDALCPS